MKQQINTKENLKKKKPARTKKIVYSLEAMEIEIAFNEDGEIVAVYLMPEQYDQISIDGDEAEELFEILSEHYKKPDAGLPWTHPHAPGIRGPIGDKTAPWQPHPYVTWNDNKTTADGTKFDRRKNPNPDAIENLDWDAETGKYVEKE